MPELTIPPGVVKTLSEATAVGRFTDMDHVRFYNQKPQKIGGWIRLNSQQLLGIPRSIYCYVQGSRLEVKIAGTEQRLYALDTSNEVTDITPYRATVAADTPGMFISTAAGSQTVTITDPAHGAQVGDRIFISPAVVIGGITVGGEYAVFTVIDVDHYTIVDNEAAAGDATLAFVSTLGYYITNGTINPQEGVGYGTGPYGAFHYGMPRSPVGMAKIKPPRFWSLDNYGTDGLFAYQGSQVYRWDESTMDRPEVMPGSPFDTIYAFVTPERFIFVLCEGMILRWPDRDNPNDWVPTPINTANIRVLGTGSHLVAGCRLGGVSLIFSDTSVYSAHYIGGNSIYATDLLGTNCGLVGPGAFAHETGTCYWFGCSSFHMYSGQISPIPNQDNVLAWILEHADPANRVKTTCWFNPPFREVWWTFASHNSPEPDLYVAVSLENFESDSRHAGACRRLAAVAAQPPADPLLKGRLALRARPEERPQRRRRPAGLALPGGPVAHSVRQEAERRHLWLCPRL